MIHIEHQTWDPAKRSITYFTEVDVVCDDHPTEIHGHYEYAWSTIPKRESILAVTHVIWYAVHTDMARLGCDHLRESDLSGLGQPHKRGTHRPNPKFLPDETPISDLERRKPLKWFGSTTCHWCGHIRKDHLGIDGTGACPLCSNCSSFAENSVGQEEARRRLKEDGMPAIFKGRSIPLW